MPRGWLVPLDEEVLGLSGSSASMASIRSPPTILASVASERTPQIASSSELASAETSSGSSSGSVPRFWQPRRPTIPSESSPRRKRGSSTSATRRQRSTTLTSRSESPRGSVGFVTTCWSWCGRSSDGCRSSPRREGEPPTGTMPPAPMTTLWPTASVCGWTLTSSCGSTTRKSAWSR